MMLPYYYYGLISIDYQYAIHLGVRSLEY